MICVFPWSQRALYRWGCLQCVTSVTLGWVLLDQPVCLLTCRKVHSHQYNTAKRSSPILLLNWVSHWFHFSVHFFWQTLTGPIGLFTVLTADRNMVGMKFEKNKRKAPCTSPCDFGYPCTHTWPGSNMHPLSSTRSPWMTDLSCRKGLSTAPQWRCTL